MGTERFKGGLLSALIIASLILSVSHVARAREEPLFGVSPSEFTEELRDVKVSISPKSESGDPGETLTYAVEITNEGNVEDTYILDASDNVDPSWYPVVSSNSITIMAGAAGVVILSVMVPSDASGGTSTEITVTAISVGDPSVTGSDTCTTIVTGVPVVENLVGVKAGDWIKYDYTISGVPAGTLPTWIKLEFLSVEGTSVTVRVTMHMTDGTESSETITEDVVAGGEISGLVIPANSKVGDSINMTGYGTVTIAGETSGTYAGASRTVVHASISQYGTQLTYYWDKQTGVMVEASVISGDLTATVKATETNIWQVEKVSWDALIAATFSGGSDDAVFDVRLDATPGFDNAYDIPEPPPPVAPPYVRTFFYYPEQTPDELHRSCLAPENLMEWPLRIEYAGGSEDITLTWNVENIPLEYSIHLYRGENLVADMRTENNYTFEASTGSYDFRIVVGTIVPFTLELTQGWSMISFPVLPENSSPDSIFDSYYVLYRWDAENKRYVLHADSGSFIEPDPDVELGVGYWAYMLEDENVDLLGILVNQLTLNLRQGWNLIGSPYGGSSIADPADDPDNSVIPWAFTWNSREKSYGMTQLLEAGRGYWVYALRDCSLTLPPKVTPPPKEPRKCVLAIEHFSPIAGTTWSGAHDRAAKRLCEKYPSLEYVYREEVGPDEAIPTARDLIATKGANIVVGNAEFMGLPLAEIADEYPDVYFSAIIASDLTTKRNFIRYFPRQYQALYLEGLIAGALTETGNIGIVSAFPCVQVCRRQAGFYLGIMDAAELLGKDITLYVKYVGDWYLPTDEAEIARTLVDTYNCDVITQQTDSGSPLDVAEEKEIWFIGKDMDIVGQYGWSSTETVAVSFDTRWEVGYEMMIKSWMAGDRTPETILYPGMDDKIILADGTVYPTVDIQNDNKVGIEAISPYARPLIPDEIVELVENRRDQMMKGVWDPFFAHDFISNGTGLALEGLPIPPAGTLVKPEGEMPSDEWLLSKFNFDLEGIMVLE